MSELFEWVSKKKLVGILNNNGDNPVFLITCFSKSFKGGYD